MEERKLPPEPPVPPPCRLVYQGGCLIYVIIGVLMISTLIFINS